MVIYQGKRTIFIKNEGFKPKNDGFWMLKAIKITFSTDVRDRRSNVSDVSTLVDVLLG